MVKLELTLFTANGFNEEKQQWKSSFHAVWQPPRLGPDCERQGSSAAVRGCPSWLSIVVCDCPCSWPSMAVHGRLGLSVDVHGCLRLSMVVPNVGSDLGFHPDDGAKGFRQQDQMDAAIWPRSDKAARVKYKQIKVIL